MKYIITLLCIILAINSNDCSATPSKLNDTFLSTLVTDIKSSAKLPSGTAIAVVYKGEVIYRGDFGYQDIENQVAVDQNTQFYIASATKPFTALNFLIDAQKEPTLHSLTLRDMFPGLSLTERESINANHLLTHTSSINNLPLVLSTAYSGEHNKQSLLESVNTLSVTSKEPVGKFKYTNVGYNIYSVFSDMHFDEDWQTKLQTQIFEPAGMLHTTAKRSSIKQQAHIAKPYSLMNLQRRSALYLEKQDSTMHAAGGIFSTSDDLARFLLIQLRNGKLDGKSIFPTEIIKRSHSQQTQTDRTYMDFHRDGYAWGWYTGMYKGSRMLHHFGGFAGAHAHLSFMPDKDIGLVVLNNEDFLSVRLTNLIANYVYGALLEETDIEMRTRERVQQLKEKLSGLDANLAKERKKISSRAWNLSLPLDEYVGEFRHPILGAVYVSKNDEQRLDVQWGVMRSRSTGMNDKDKIRVELEPTSGSVVVFDVSDKVNSLNYAGVTFQKVKIANE